jgi:hypothetical protein
VILSRPPDALDRCRQTKPGGELQLMVLATDRHSCIGVDLRSRALVRAWSAVPIDARLRPYDVVGGRLDSDPDVMPDPTEPEAMVVAEGLECTGRLRGRRAERYLRPLLHPPAEPLLGLTGVEVLFWERSIDQPSVAVVKPETSTTILSHRHWMVARFGWRGSRVELPLVDRWIADSLARTGQSRMVAGHGERLVVAFTPPISGRCHKVVAAVLPHA